MAMAIANIGEGGVLAVERELRPSVEHQVRTEWSKKEESKRNASTANQKALQMYNSVVESINLTCPRCKMVFDDYEGCNALQCGNVSCSAKFCAICLKDCGQDAHPHVREKHGNLFDKAMFYKSREARATQTIADFLTDLRKKGETFEVIQLVENQLHKGGHLGDSHEARANNFEADRFVRSASADLERVIQSDRLSVLKDDDSGWKRSGISREHVSPRCLIPDYIKLYLVPDSSQDVYRLSIVVEVDDKKRSVEAEEVKDLMTQGQIPVFGPMLNIMGGIRCAVVAVEGAKRLYQVKKGGDKDKKCVPSELPLMFKSVNSEGDTEEVSREFWNGPRRRLLAVNGNDRLLLLQAYIKEHVTGQSIPAPLKHFVGVGKPKPVLTELCATPETGRLNENQIKAAHPLHLKTACEVAGPPGSGKTQVITELVRGLLSCTSKKLVVLSERNGAIDAVAEKFLSSCFKIKNGKLKKLVDVEMWLNILTFGSAEAMGPHTKEFSLENKLK
jgi:hypothetical protein